MDARNSLGTYSGGSSLDRLRIDLHYQHLVDAELPTEDVAGAVNELTQAGILLHLGLREASARVVRRAHALQPAAAVQAEDSLMNRHPERNGVRQTCEVLGIGFVTRWR